MLASLIVLCTRDKSKLIFASAGPPKILSQCSVVWNSAIASLGPPWPPGVEREVVHQAIFTAF